MKAIADDLRLVCPICHGLLERTEVSLNCDGCQRSFPFERGRPNLIEGGRFEDSLDAERIREETASNEYSMRSYFLPLLRRLCGGSGGEPRILSVGCGIGVDVDFLNGHGFQAYGIDCGSRSAEWENRNRGDRLFLANAQHLPFDEGAFDAVFCGCLFPHVGVAGDSRTLLPTAWQERLSLARELARVLKTGGAAIVASPNRRCPVDLFHGKKGTQRRILWNSPFSEFLLAASDYRRLFEACGCRLTEVLPPRGYWGFQSARQSWKGRLLSAPLDAWFGALSTPALRAWRSSPLNPWLILLARKGE